LSSVRRPPSGTPNIPSLTSSWSLRNCTVTIENTATADKKLMDSHHRPGLDSVHMALPRQALGQYTENQHLPKIVENMTDSHLLNCQDQHMQMRLKLRCGRGMDINRLRHRLHWPWFSIGFHFFVVFYTMPSFYPITV
jgi:hypothetical protein